MKRLTMKILTLLLLLVAPEAFAQFTQTQRQELRDANLLAPFNPGFENGKQSWTNASGTFATTTSSSLVGIGSTAGQWTAAGSGNTLTSKAVTVPAGLFGAGCQGSLFHKAGDANVVMEVVDTTTSTTLGSLTLATQTNYVNDVIPFTCPTAADTVVLRLRATATSALFDIDSAFLGAPAFTGIVSTNPNVLTEPKTLVGTVGSAGQIAAGHVLTTTEWPFTVSGKLAYWNFASSATTDNSGALSCTSAACTLTNNGTVPVTGTNIFGTANAAVTFNGSTQYLSNTNAFFNPGNGKSFALGGWFKLTSWATGVQMLMSNETSGTDSGFYFYTDGNGKLNASGTNTSNNNDLAIISPAMGFSAGSWHHIALVYNFAATTLTLYADGRPVASGILANQRSLTASTLEIGAYRNGTNLMTGTAEDLFFVNNVTLTSDDIRKASATTWSHNSVSPSNQVLTGNWYRSDSNIANPLTSAWVVHKDTSTLYTDFSDQASTAFVDFAIASSAMTPVTIPVASYDSSWLSTTPPTTIPHGLGAIPGHVEIIYQSNIGATPSYESLKSGDWCSYDITNLYCDWTGLTLGGGNQIKIQAWLPGTQVAVQAAGSATSGVVNTTAQTFSGAKTFSGAMDAAGGWAADTAAYATGSVPGLMSATTQTLGGAKTFNANIFVASGQGVSIGTSSPNGTLEVDGASGVMLATNRGSSAFLSGQGGNTSVIFQNSATSGQSNQVQIVAGASGTAELDLTTPTGGGGSHGLISYSNATDTLLLGAGGVGNLSVTTNGVVTIGVNGVTTSTVHEINGRLVQNDSGTDSAQFYMAACTTGGAANTWTLGTSTLPSNSNSNVIYGHVEVTVNSGSVGATNTYVCNFGHYGTGAGFNQNIGTCTALAGGSGSTTTPTLGVVSGGSNPMVWQIVIPAGGNSVVRTTVGRRNGSSWVFNTTGC